MPELSFDEINDWNKFEELVAAFFRSLMSSNEKHFQDVTVKPSGVGSDGGKDILVDFTISDYIKQFTRTWVIQCKFHEENISPNQLFGVDLPTLIHSHNACGYLLICKSRPTTGLTNLFHKLNHQSTHFKYNYEIWSGEEFKGKLISAHPSIHEQYFPKYYKELKQIDSQAKR